MSNDLAPLDTSAQSELVRSGEASTSEGPPSGDNRSGLTAELVVSRSVRDIAFVLDADPKGLRIALATEPALATEVDPVWGGAEGAAGFSRDGIGLRAVRG